MFPQFPSLWCVNSLNPLMASSKLQDNIMKKLTDIVNLLGFTRSKSYYSLFTKCTCSQFLVLLYVDDILIVGPTLILLHNLRNNTDFSYSLVSCHWNCLFYFWYLHFSKKIHTLVTIKYMFSCFQTCLYSYGSHINLTSFEDSPLADAS